MLLFPDHHATVYQRLESANPVTKLVGLPEEAPGVEIVCLIEPLRNTVVVDSRTGAELVNPYRIFVDPADVDIPTYGARLVVAETGQQFRVTNKPSLQPSGGNRANLAYAKGELELLEMQG